MPSSAPALAMALEALAVKQQLLAAALDKRVGGKNPEGTFDTWANANAALEFWAKRMRFVACENRKGTNCEKP